MPERWPIGLLHHCAGVPRSSGTIANTTEKFTMLALIGTIIVGGIIGLIARAIKPGDDSMGWIMTIILGIAGSLVAGYAGRALGWYHEGQAAGWIASVVGAIVLLFIW